MAISFASGKGLELPFRSKARVRVTSAPPSAWDWGSVIRVSLDSIFLSDTTSGFVTQDFPEAVWVTRMD